MCKSMCALPLLLALVVTNLPMTLATGTMPQMYGLTRVANSPSCSGAVSGCLQLVSIDLGTGKLSNIGKGHTPLAAVGDLRVVADNVYYVLADECGKPCNSTGSVLLGISTTDGSEVCRRKVPSLAEVGLVGGGQSLHHDTKNNRLILSGLNSTDGGKHFTHVLLSSPLKTCGPFTRLGEFEGDSSYEPMCHGSDFDAKSQRLFLTLSTGEHTYGIGVVDVAGGKLIQTYPMSGRISLWGPTYMSNEQLVGTESNPLGEGIDWVSLNLTSGNWTSTPLKYASNVNITFPGLEGNLGSARSYDSTSGMLYVMGGRGDPSNPTLEIITIDTRTGMLVAHSGVLNGDVGFSGSILSQFSIATSAPLAALANSASSTATISFSKPSTTGHSFESRRDPIMLSFPSVSSSTNANAAHVLCSGVVNNKSTYVESNNGGLTWTPASKSVADASYGWSVGVGQTTGSISGSVGGIPSGYLKNESQMTGPWKATHRLIYSINNTDSTIAVTDEAKSTFWQSLPNPVGLLAFDSGGVTWLGGTTYIATVWVWYSDVPLEVNHGNPCCNGSVVAYISNDNGKNWQFQSEIASKKSINEMVNTGGATWSISQEGPNENDVVLLKDGVTLLCVMRIDGGDGVPNHTHVPYLLATSVDRGLTWSMREAPKYMLSARPRAIVLPNGVLVVSGGRPALSMWISIDGFGNSWKEYDIPTEHNRGIQTMSGMTKSQLRVLPGFCSEFENATDKNLGWMQSSCYTRLGVLAHDTGIVCYEMQGAGSGGEKTPPPECAFKGSEVFCMRFTVNV